MTTITQWHRPCDSNARWIARGLAVACVSLLILTGGLANASETIAVGQWVDSSGQAVPETRVIGRLREADIALFGEVHDAKAIHRKQLELLRRIDRPIVLAMEQLDRDVAIPALNDGNGGLSARERARRGGFDFEGWGWDQYGVLFALATERQWPLWPINLSRERAFALARADASDWRQQLSATERAEMARLGAELGLPGKRHEALLADLREAHCGRLASTHVAGMARAQVARDVLMASSLADARGNYPGHAVVAIMGNQHARKDRGAAYWLIRGGEIEPPRLVSVGMLPVDSFDDLSIAAGPYDFVWISEAVPRHSPCDSG